MRIYLLDSAGPSDRRALERAATHADGIRSITYVSKKVSFAELRRKYPDMTQNLMSNPLPNSYDMTFDNAVDATLAAHELGGMAGVQRTRAPSNCPESTS